MCTGEGIMDIDGRTPSCKNCYAYTQTESTDMNGIEIMRYWYHCPIIGWELQKISFLSCRPRPGRWKNNVWWNVDFGCGSFLSVVCLFVCVPNPKWECPSMFHLKWKWMIKDESPMSYTYISMRWGPFKTQSGSPTQRHTPIYILKQTIYLGRDRDTRDLCTCT